jgi:Uncharacterized conserved protein
MKELESLKGVFKDRLFKIPDYQRGFAWTARQLKDFWEDIVNLPNERFHYTGLLSLKEVDKAEWKNWNEEGWLISDRGFNPFYVVDGQQRLTTFVIFINEIVNLVRKQPENKDKRDEDIYIGTFNLRQIREEYIVIQQPPYFIIKTYKFGYSTDSQDFKFLKHKILEESDGGFIQENVYTLNLENAKRFFKDNLKNYFNENGILGIETVFKKVTQNLMFNLHEIQDDFDVFIAFETMNNRGKKLSNLELLKNRLIYLTTLYENNGLKNDAITVLRTKINDVWKEVYVQLGRNKQKPLSDDDFLRAHWIMYFQYTKQRGDDYIRFLLEEKFTPKSVYKQIEIKDSSVVDIEEIGDDGQDEDDTPDIEIIEKIVQQDKRLSPKDIEDYVGSLKSTAVHWYNTYNPIDNPNLTKEESIWLDKLNRIGITYFRPLVTVSFISPGVSSSDRVKLFKEIERFIFIAFRLGRAFSTYRNSEYYKIAKLLRCGEISIDDICQRLKDRIENWLKPETAFDYKPFKVYLQRQFQNGGGGFYYWSGLRYFLYEYETEKVNQLGTKKLDWSDLLKGEKDKISIEHILPQTPDKECWEKAFSGFSKEQLDFMKGSFGNLLILSSSINSSLQNDCFLEKKNAKKNSQGETIRGGYLNGSHSENEVAESDKWDADEILKRGLKLLAFMERRWNIKFIDEVSKKDLLFLDFL